MSFHAFHLISKNDLTELNLRRSRNSTIILALEALALNFRGTSDFLNKPPSDPKVFLHLP